ncbi:MAG: hypothetical protein ACXW27_07280 [Allosphingosinicella sp.]
MRASSDRQPEGPLPPAGPAETAQEAPEISRQDDRLDEALEETFPASDPVSIYLPN